MNELPLRLLAFLPYHLKNSKNDEKITVFSFFNKKKKYSIRKTLF